MSEKDGLCLQPSKPFELSFEPCVGDQGSLSKGIRLLDPPSSTSITSNYKISLPPSMETQIRKLKLSLEPWREIVLYSNKVLLWEQKYYASALLTGITFLFTIILLADPSILTVISLTGLALTLADYFMPLILQSIFKPEMWSGDKQKEFEEICTNIILYKTKAELLLSSYCRMRVTNPKLYFGITILTLTSFAWIGSTVDNLLLTYLLVTFLIMLPGMQHHGMLNKFSETFSKLFNELVENAKARVGQKKTQ